MQKVELKDGKVYVDGNPITHVTGFGMSSETGNMTEFTVTFLGYTSGLDEKEFGIQEGEGDAE